MRSGISSKGLQCSRQKAGINSRHPEAPHLEDGAQEVGCLLVQLLLLQHVQDQQELLLVLLSIGDDWGQKGRRPCSCMGRYEPRPKWKLAP